MSNGYGRSTQGFGIDRDASVKLIVKAALDAGVEDPRQIAYMLATAQHETEDFQAPEEHFGRSQARKLDYGGGEEFYGRGYVHLTHDYNYKTFDDLLQMNGELVRNPGRAIEPEIAAHVMVVGMRDGLFTSKRLDRYINDETQDFYNARRVVNGVNARQSWSIKAAEDCERFAGEWAKVVPDLIESVRKEQAQGSFDPVRDLREAVARIPGAGAASQAMTDGMPDYLRVAPARPDTSLNDGKLSLGEKEEAVRNLQKTLNSVDGYDASGQTLATDGVYGRSTYQAVENFQLWNGLATTGVADRETLRAIENASRKTRSPNADDARSIEGTVESGQQGQLNEANHPDHALYQQALGQIQKLPRQRDRTPDDIDERFAAALTVQSKEQGLQSINHVVLSKDGSRAFAVDTPDITAEWRRRADLEVSAATHQPMEVSSQRVAQVNEHLAQQMELDRQQAVQQGPDDPSRGGPRMI